MAGFGYSKQWCKQSAENGIAAAQMRLKNALAFSNSGDTDRALAHLDAAEGGISYTRAYLKKLGAIADKSVTQRIVGE